MRALGVTVLTAREITEKVMMSEEGVVASIVTCGNWCLRFRDGIDADSATVHVPIVIPVSGKRQFFFPMVGFLTLGLGKMRRSFHR